MKIFKWISEHILFILTLFFLAFIPLYPKLPLIDIKNTWVYIRIEDVLVVCGIFIWFYQLVRGKISLKTPLTMPIFVFWAFGALATIHAVLIIFPSLSNVFSNVAFLSFLRRIEYISLFFIAFSAMKDKKLIPIVVAMLSIILLVLVGYGIGQKYFGFPAFLTMNEEYAKGVPIYLSSQSRVPSTFGGHYDLAAYLVLIIPILTSMIFGFKKWLIRIGLAVVVTLGFFLLFLTVSRISFFVLLVALVFLLFFQKKRVVLFAIPIGAIILIILSLNFSNSLLSRFGNTVKEIDVLVDAKTGEPIGHVKTVLSKSYVNKLIIRRNFSLLSDLKIEDKDPFLASSSAIVPVTKLPTEVIEVIPQDTPTGENLPQGTDYINLSLSPVTKRLPVFFYERSSLPEASLSSYVTMFTGNFVVKKARAYDLSLTTRVQGEWPNAINAFKRNILFGSGYSSVTLAVDNNFLRILGEVGLGGFIAFFGIFIIAGLYLAKILPNIDSNVVKSFILGFFAGVFGLFLNALFIDVFEASKVAYVLWLLMGVTVGSAYLYQKNIFSLPVEIKKAIISPYAIFTYIAILAFVMFWPIITNYYIGDDFTWLRWASDCSNMPGGICPSVFKQILHYFTNADGFFYRPGTKIYFFLMYSFFWLNQEVYHIVSLSLHISVTILMFLLIRKVTKNNLLSVLSAILFLILSGYSEIVLWIAATGHLFNAMFILLSVLLFLKWEEQKKNIFYILSLLSFLLSLLFHELGIVVPLLILLCKYAGGERFHLTDIFKKIHYLLLFVPLIFYLVVRFFVHSHWFNGDYSYNLLHLPFNFIGNAIGYFLLALFGPAWLSIYQIIREHMKDNIFILSVVFLFIGAGAGYYILRMNGLKKIKTTLKKINEHDRRIIFFAGAFFIITLLPFLGLGNITSRYSYLASGGVVMLFVFFLIKLHGLLQKSGKDIAIAVFITIIATFSLFNIVQTQQIQGDWHEAGIRTKRFITDIDAKFEDHWANAPMKFHFVNVPIKVGDAWMFPVGLQDALWFVFQNPNARVYQDKTVEDALSTFTGNVNERIFLFKDDGSIVGVRRVSGLPIYDE